MISMRENKLLLIWLVVLTVLGVYNCFHCKVDLRLNISSPESTSITAVTKAVRAD